MKFNVLCLLLAGAMLLSGPASAQAPVVVKIAVYPNSTLYKNREETGALQLGAVQMLAQSLARSGSLGSK